MERNRINSSLIRSVGYDPSTRTMEVELSNGSVMRYERVPREIYRRFVSAPSLTSYFRDNIEEEFTARRLK